MELRQLQCFVAVAEELHFRKAGERLGLSQPALSERISSLEHELGFPLFFRTTRQVSLTQAGSEFLKDAQRILADIDKSVSHVRHVADSGLKALRVSGVDEALSLLFPPALIAFRKHHPNVHIELLEISSSDYHTQELINHRTDIAFVRNPPDDEFLSSEYLSSQSAVVVVPDGNPLSEKDAVSVEDIKDFPLIGFPKRSRPILHEMLWSSFRKRGLQPDIVCEVIDKSTMLQLVAHGIGIALIPAWVQTLSPKGLKFVPYRESVQRIDLYISYRTKGNAREVQAFIDAVKQASEQISRF
ncbi:LysR family transcriptional regulator [Pacificoceanicola onchidii]|uniref:LysR family transcriptional regulator n=1 Tax=Pacificoceanicola onchidii TaxID=2562685 RepID=UPI0010A5D73D|nr:LysR family transcriptional regulator [Pacificoceanicola onchidii]